MGRVGGNSYLFFYGLTGPRVVLAIVSVNKVIKNWPRESRATSDSVSSSSFNRSEAVLLFFLDLRVVFLAAMAAALAFLAAS